MSLNSSEEARQYIKSVCDHLDALTKLSIQAGLDSHASVWLTIHAAFLKSPDEMQTIVDMIGMYLEASAARYQECRF